LGSVIPFKTNISYVEHQATDEGRAAAAFLMLVGLKAKRG
jgi:hypothetical protein